MKQTAVLFLYEFVQLKLTDEQQAQFEGLFQQAFDMEKEQMIQFCTEYTTSLMYGDGLTPNEFYTQTFNK